MHNRAVRMAVLGALTGASLAGPTLALAQQSAPALEELVVTAQKRAENIQDVPIAITALSGADLQNQHVTSVMGLNQLAPGLQVKADDNAANPKIFIRGVGLNDFNPNTASAVGIYADGVYIGSPLAQMGQFFDIERLEILRGPQGTLYGRNTTGGTINIITRKPTQEFQADANLEYGRFGGTNFEGAIGGGLTPTLAGRLAANIVHDDGYTENRLTGQFGNDSKRAAVRGSLDFKPSDSFDALLQLRYGRSDGGSILAYNRPLFPVDPTGPEAGPDGFCAPGFFRSGLCTDIAGYANTSGNLYAGDYHLQGRDSVTTRGASATLTWDLGAASLISVSAYDNADRDDHEDTDAGPNNVITARYVAKQNVYSEELRLQSNAKDTPVDWVAGLYYAHDHLSTSSYYDVLRIFRPIFATPDNPDGFNPDLGIGTFGWPYRQNTESWAGFGQLDYHFTSALTGTLGLRYSHDKKDFAYTSTAEGAIEIFSLAESKDFSSVSGKLGLQYKFSDDVNAYLTYNRGFKSGGFFGGQTADPADLKPYNDEKVDAYEVGVKTEWLDHRLRANLSAFYYNYQDLQVYTLVVRGVITVQNFTNASNARIYGGEAELNASPVEGLDLSLSSAWLNATYQDFASAGVDYSGNRLPNSPRASFTAAARYEWAALGGKLSTQLDATYRSKIFYDTRNVERLSDKERTFVNARVGWSSTDGHYEYGLWGRNLFDETNISDIIPIEGLGFDLFAMGMPRTYGVYARWKY